MSMLELYEASNEDVFHSKHGVINLDNASTLSRRQKSLLSMALKIAETSDMPQKHGAIIVKSGRVLALGVNKWRNKDLRKTQNGYNPNLTYHAEVDALNRFADVRGATIYIARLGKNGEPRFSRPCSRCLEALQDAGIKKIVYTTNQQIDL
jgi:deoxycytidylate deaminase